jgi:hypothetical protein
VNIRHRDELSEVERREPVAPLSGGNRQGAKVVSTPAELMSVCHRFIGDDPARSDHSAGKRPQGSA